MIHPLPFAKSTPFVTPADGASLASLIITSKIGGVGLPCPIPPAPDLGQKIRTVLAKAAAAQSVETRSKRCGRHCE
jgi:hypothetical protein